MLSYKKINKKNRSGEIGETATWIVATVIILVIMLIFLGISLLMSKNKAVNVGDVRTDLSQDYERLEMKTSLAEKLNSQDKATIESILEEQNG